MCDMVEDKYKIEKYVCFRKRLEKYKARGFKIHDESELVKSVRYILDVNIDDEL